MSEQQDAHPEFGPRDHPDLHVTMITGFETPQAPALDADDVHQAIGSDVARAVAMLLELDERAEWPGSTWSRPSATTLSATVAKYPLDGIAVLTEDPDDAHEFRQTVLAAWRQSASSAEHIDTIIAAISAWDLPPIASRDRELLRPFGERSQARAARIRHELARSHATCGTHLNQRATARCSTRTTFSSMPTTAQRGTLPNTGSRSSSNSGARPKQRGARSRQASAMTFRAASDPARKPANRASPAPSTSPGSTCSGQPTVPGQRHGFSRC